MADSPTSPIDPLEVARKLGLNVPTQDDVTDLAVRLAQLFGPQADVAGMVQDASRVIPAIKRGDLAEALSSIFMAGAAVPMMALPGTVGGIRKVTELASKRAVSLDLKSGIPEAAAKYIKATPAEDKFWRSFLDNPANREELLESVPSFKYEGRSVSVSKKDINKLSDWVDTTIALDGPASVPPRLNRGRGDRWWRELFEISTD